jgi:tetratricopeptide (TPR) repeat protein
VAPADTGDLAVGFEEAGPPAPSLDAGPVDLVADTPAGGTEAPAADVTGGDTAERGRRDQGQRGFREERGFRGDRDRADRDRGFRDNRGPRDNRGFREERGYRDDRRPAGGYRRAEPQQEAGGFGGAPAIPEDVNPRDLAPEVREELRSLSSSVANSVAGHLVAAGQLLDDDPEAALEHARAARQLAPRIAAVREALGVTSYHNGEWQAAISELRTYHRLTGRQTHLAVLADCERALGRPERAIDIYRTADRAKLAPDEAVELLIVAAGARGDMGQRDAAVAMLQVRELTAASREPWVVRLRYAYAESLLAAGRREEAREWFARAADIDDELATDAAERLLELDGVVLEDVVDAEYDEDEDELADDEAEEEEALADVDDDLADEELDGDELDGEGLDERDFDAEEREDEDLADVTGEVPDLALGDRADIQDRTEAGERQGDQRLVDADGDTVLAAGSADDSDLDQKAAEYDRERGERGADGGRR